MHRWDVKRNATHLDLELRSFGLSEYLLLECFSRDLDRLRECLLLWRRLLGDFVLERDRPIFSRSIVVSVSSVQFSEAQRATVLKSSLDILLRRDKYPLNSYTICTQEPPISLNHKWHKKIDSRQLLPYFAWECFKRHLGEYTWTNIQYDHFLIEYEEVKISFFWLDNRTLFYTIDRFSNTVQYVFKLV